MNFEYPILPSNTKDEEKIENLNSNFYGHNNQLGFYPIGRLNSWHGGIHIETGGRAIHSIADGRIIAYRMADCYLPHSEESDHPPYSNGFILIQHDFIKKGKNSKDVEASLNFRFYSLYMHLMPKEAMNEKGLIPDLYAKNTTKNKSTNFERGLTSRTYVATQTKKPLKEDLFIQRGTILTKSTKNIPEGHWMLTKSGKKNYVLCEYGQKTICAYLDSMYPDPVVGDKYQVNHTTKELNTFSGTDGKAVKGTMVYDSVKGKCIRLEKEAFTFDIEHTSDPNWYKAKGKKEYVLAKDCEKIIKQLKDDVKTDSIENVDLAIKAGTELGFVGNYGFKGQKNYSALHLEVFTDDSDNLKKLIANQPAFNDKLFLQVPGGSVLKKEKPIKGLTKDLFVKVTEQKGTYVKVTFETKQITTKDVVWTSDDPKKDTNGKVLYKGFSSSNGYDIMDFDTLNANFNDILKEETAKIYWAGKGATSSERTVSLVKKHKDHPLYKKEYWIPKSSVSSQPAAAGTPTTFLPYWSKLTAQVNEVIEKEATLSSKDTITLPAGEPMWVDRTMATTKNKDNQDCVLVKGSYYNEQEVKTIVQGWLLKSGLRNKNAAHWQKDYNWKILENTGDQYFYQFDTKEGEEAHDFIKQIWQQADTNKDKVLTQLELQNAMRSHKKVKVLSRLICKHVNEWDTWKNVQAFRAEVDTIYVKGIEKATGEEKTKLEEAKKERVALIEKKIENLCFWDKITSGDVLSKQQRKEAYFKSKGAKPLNGAKPTLGGGANAKAALDKKLTDEFEELEKNRMPRQFPSSSTVYHFHPIAFVGQMKLITGKSYKKGDKGKDHGKILQEINIRLAGFGGNVPDEDFTERTEKSVIQFQKDYMKIEPTGIVDNDTLNAIDEFNEKYTFTFDQIKCKCSTKGKKDKNVKTGLQELNKCNGFGDHSSKGKNYYERPGVHRSVLFGLKALLFYFEKNKSPYTLNKISSGYRCRFHPEFKKWKTTNHLGRALDLHFDKNGKRTREVVDTELIRKNYFVKYMNAPETDGGQTHGFGWKKNHFGLEPKIQNNGRSGATSWVHVDIREFESKYQKDTFFIKNEKDLLSEKIINLI